MSQSRSTRTFSAFFALCVAFAGLTQVARAEGSARGNIAFRTSGVDVKRVDKALQEKADTDKELKDQKTSLEAELRYAQSRLEAARKALTIATATSASAEQTDKLDVEVRDWEARVRSCQERLADLEKESHSSETAGNDDVIVPGDNIEIFVVEDKSFNGRYEVRRGGYILMPQVGRISVAGKTVSAAEAAVRRSLEASQLQHASVMIERLEGSAIAEGPLIYLSGQFQQPRPWRIPKGTKPTLLSVILNCGGLAAQADLAHVRVMRVASYKGLVEEVDVRRMLQGEGLTSDLTLHEGDVVVVPAREQKIVYLTGNVKRAGTMNLPANTQLMAYEALLQNGGFSRFADLRRTYILRTNDDGRKSRIPLNIAAIQKGQRADIPLEKNDIIVVPEKFFSF
jgi:protein involved in polysaccharide export with SLBB domain/Skp family chaperone for outer membrane proteins